MMCLKNHRTIPQDLIPPPVKNKKLFSNNYAREIIGWPRVGPTCGQGLRLGIIDGDVNTTHAQLIDRDVTFRNFVRTKSKPIAEEACHCYCKFACGP